MNSQGDSIAQLKSLDPKLPLLERLTAYGQLRAFETDNNESHDALRTAASTWIIAGIGAIGWVLFDGKPSTLPFASTLLLISAVCLLTSLGLLLLWMIDQRIYQELLHSTFAYGLVLEHAHPDLPQIRTVMYAANKNISAKLSLYYFFPVAVFAAASSFCAWQEWQEHHLAAWIAALNWLMLAVCCFCSRRPSTLESTLRALDRAALHRLEKFGEEIRAHRHR